MLQLLENVKSYTAFFLLLMVLLHLVPQKGYRKYIHFFMGMLLVFAFLSPVLTLLFDSDAFLDAVELEAWQVQMEELEKDTDRVAFLQKDYYEEQCKKIAALELEQITSNLGYEITESEITLGEEGGVAAVSLCVQQKQEEIEVAEVQIGEETREKEECMILQEAVMAYYQLEEDAVSVYQ